MSETIKNLLNAFNTKDITHVTQILDSLIDNESSLKHIGIFNAEIKRCIRNDEFNFFKHLFPYVSALKGNTFHHKRRIFEEILLYDAIECFKLIYDNITITHEDYSFLSHTSSYKISEYLVGKNNWTILYYMHFKNNIHSSIFTSFFIKSWNNGAEYCYQTATLFHNNYIIVKWILDHLPNYIPHSSELMGNFFWQADYQILKLFCDHNEKEWSQLNQTNQFLVDPKRFITNQYYDIIYFPFSKRLPKYLLYDLLCHTYPNNMILKNQKFSLYIIDTFL